MPHSVCETVARRCVECPDTLRSALENRVRVGGAATLVFEIATGASRVLAQQAAFSTDSSTALALCRKADNFSGDQKERILTRGLVVAERAIAADRNDAQAHFAVFCNL